MVDSVKIITDFCIKNLDLENSKLGNEYFYQSLPLCVIDAVFSIGIKYQTTQAVVQRYCDYFKINKIRTDKNLVPDIKSQQSISNFLEMHDKYYFTEQIFQNRNRTSPQNGILKSEAVFLFADVLKKYQIEYFQDIYKFYINKKIGEEVMQIPGQRSGISLKYFLMLAGNNDLIKPDRQILSFLKAIIGYSVSIEEAQEILLRTCCILKKDFPTLTLRLLDYLIWNYQRSL